MVLAALTVACTQDDPAALDAPETAAVTTSTSTIVDFEAYNPITETPNRSFDNASEGVYLGIIVTQDVSVHGQIWVNLGNNGDYNATVVTDNREQMSFYGTPTSRSQHIVSFTGKEGSFIFDARDLNSPIATEVMVNGKEGYIQTVKDRSDQRAAVALGTYVDDNDPAFTGSWDLITDGTTVVADAFGLPALTQVCIVAPGGAMFIDTVFETFDYPCFVLDGPIAPVFHAAGGAFGDVNEFWAQNQNVNILGQDLNYFIGQSTSAHSNNPDFTNPGFHVFPFDADMDPMTPDVLTCLVFEDGQQGLWAWNGRLGRATFMDPFVPTPPTVAPNTNADIEAFQEAMSNITVEKADFSPFE